MYLQVFKSTPPRGAQRHNLGEEVRKAGLLREVELDASWWSTKQVLRKLSNLDQQEKQALKKAAAQEAGEAAGEPEEEFPLRRWECARRG